MVQQATLTWAINGGGIGKTALMFNSGTTNADIIQSFTGFKNAITAYLANSTVVALDPEVKRLNDQTGALENISTLTPPSSGVGVGGNSPVPNAAQGLIQWRTATVIGGRFVKGRLYVPGLSSTFVSGSGELNSSAVTGLTTAGLALANSAFLGVWHRPKNGAGGVFCPISGVGTWSELAVQRRRRK